jgi:hypothetical protein
MSAVNNHTQVLENGLRELRYELTSDPLRTTLDLGTEAIILSGLRQKCQHSMGHIQRLYEETKFLKSYLEKMESQAYFDLERIEKQPQGPSLLRKMTFLLSIGFIFGYFYKQKFPNEFQVKMEEFKSVGGTIMEILSVNAATSVTNVTSNIITE